MPENKDAGGIRLTRAEAIAVVAASLLGPSYTTVMIINEDEVVSDAADILDAANLHVQREREMKENSHAG